MISRDPKTGAGLLRLEWGASGFCWGRAGWVGLVEPGGRITGLSCRPLFRPVLFGLLVHPKLGKVALPFRVSYAHSNAHLRAVAPSAHPPPFLQELSKKETSPVKFSK